MPVLIACGQSDTDASRGKTIADEHCAMCHATGLTGESPISDAPPLREIAKRWPPEYLAEAFAEGISVGHSDKAQMPELRFDTNQIDGLIAYLKKLEANQ